MQRWIHNKSSLDMTFKRIKTEVKKIDGTFVAFTKVKVFNNERLHLKLLPYFEDLSFILEG